MIPTGAEFRDRCLSEFESEAARKYNKGDKLSQAHPASAAGILRENCYEEIGQEIIDSWFYFRALGWQRRRALELLYAALGDSHAWRGHVMRAASLLETGKE